MHLSVMRGSSSFTSNSCLDKSTVCSGAVLLVTVIHLLLLYDAMSPPFPAPMKLYL